MNRPAITINGVQLSPSQAMTMCVALNSFASQLREDGLGKDDVGSTICAGYLEAIKAIWKMMEPRTTFTCAGCGRKFDVTRTDKCAESLCDSCNEKYGDAVRAMHA